MTVTLDENGLNAKQDMFCREYLTDLNAKQAAIRAGYAERSAEMQGSRLMSLDKVKLKIQSLKDKRAEKLDTSAEWVVNRLREIAMGSMGDFAEWGAVKLGEHDGESFEEGKVRFFESAQLSDEKKRIVSEVSEGKDGIKIKLNDRVRALELLGRHNGMFTDVVKFDASEDFSSLMVKLFAKK